MAQDSDIDRLYRLPLGEFTAARDALAKAAGAGGASIKGLQKPNAAAWAVNQLYWQRRKTFDRLVTASARLRAATGKKLSGKETDVGGADAAHRTALAAALHEARALLQDAGDSASPTTMTAVHETLEALPSSAPAGRLSRPLRPGGFEALAGLLDASPRRADVIPIGVEAKPVRTPPPSAAAAAKRAADDRRREVAELEQELRAATAGAQQAEAALARVQQAVQRAEEDRDKLATDLERAQVLLHAVQGNVGPAAGRSRDAAASRDRLARQLAAARERK